MQDLGFTGIANINSTYSYIHGDVRPGKWYGDEYKYGNGIIPAKDFYTFYGLTKKDVYGYDDEVTPAPTPEPVVTPPEEPVEGPKNNELTAGTKLTLKNVPLYASATNTKYSSKKSGTFYVYSDEVVNNRIRVTNLKSNVGKTPAGKYVSGWINVSDAK
jgi:hypothetical protein